MEFSIGIELPQLTDRSVGKHTTTETKLCKFISSVGNSKTPWICLADMGHDKAILVATVVGKGASFSVVRQSGLVTEQGARLYAHVDSEDKSQEKGNE
jgi:hypothetical protein